MPETFDIIDKNGTAHEFPVGFDPKRAAVIVSRKMLGEANAKPLSEPTTFDEGVRKSVGETASKVGTGIGKGLNPMPFLKATVNREPGLPAHVDESKGTIVDDRPKGPGVGAELASLSDPEKGGEAIGNLGGMLIAGRLPLKRIARGAGGVIQDYDITHPVKPIGDFLKYVGREKVPASPAVPLSEDLGANARVLHGPEQFREPYNIPAVEKPTSAMDIGRLTGNKAPTLQDSLLEALNGAREGEKPTLVSSHPPTDVVGAGPLKQSGKFGKSGSMGQPGGYTSGNPPMSDAEYDRLLQRFGGKEHSLLPGDTHPSVGTSDWHSGAEPGSAEAQSAQSLHKETGAMDMAFKGKMDDPLASLLVTALLGGGSAGALMSSHGDQ